MDLRAGRGACGLKVLPLTDRWAQRGFALCFLGERQLSPAAKLLVAHLEGVARSRKLRVIQPA